jgi:hypothetical protein
LANRRTANFSELFRNDNSTNSKVLLVPACPEWVFLFFFFLFFCLFFSSFLLAFICDQLA